MTFYSIGIAFYTGQKSYTFFPLNLLLLPLLRLFNLNAPIYLFEEAAHETQ
jgi:hypothetical protein